MALRYTANLPQSKLQRPKFRSLASDLAWLLRLTCAITALAFAGCSAGDVSVADRAAAGSGDDHVARIAVQAAVDVGTVTVGDLVRYTLEVEYDAELMIDEFKVPEQLGDLEVVDSGRTVLRVVRGRGGIVEWVVLRATSVGSYIVPPQEMTGTAEDGNTFATKSAQVFVEVVSVLPEGASDIRGLKPLEEDPAVLPWILGGVGLLLLLIGLWAWRRRRSDPAVEIALLPHERAFRDLEALRSTNFGDLEQLREYYFSLSAILRAYIEARFGLNATDLTTQEITRRLDEIGPLDAVQESSLVAFCKATDSVKYAASVPREDEIEQVYEAALGFVEQTTPASTETDAAAGDDTPGGPPKSLSVASTPELELEAEAIPAEDLSTTASGVDGQRFMP